MATDHWVLRTAQHAYLQTVWLVRLRYRRASGAVQDTHFTAAIATYVELVLSIVRCTVVISDSQETAINAILDLDTLGQRFFADLALQTVRPVVIGLALEHAISAIQDMG